MGTNFGGVHVGCHCWGAMGAIAGVPLLGAIARCHCWVPLLAAMGAIAGVPLLGAIAGVPLLGAIVGCHGWMPLLGAIAGVPLLGAIAWVPLLGCHCWGAIACENLITHLNQIFLCLNSLVSHACVTLLF